MNRSTRKGAQQQSLAQTRRRQNATRAHGFGSGLRRGVKPFVVLFTDDSTLIFAQRMREVLLAADPNCTVQTAWLTDETALSYRQISQLLPQGPDHILTGNDLVAMMSNPDVHAILTSRVYRAMVGSLKNPVKRWAGNRPCIVSFLGGLDFFPKQGFMRRAHCDGVYLFPYHAIEDYRALTADLDAFCPKAHRMIWISAVMCSFLPKH